MLEPDSKYTLPLGDCQRPIVQFTIFVIKQVYFQPKSIPNQATAIMVVVIDNYDSFTYNLVQRLGEIDPAIDIRVFRNDQVTVDELTQLNPSRVLISPGPCTPTEAGISIDVVRHFAGRVPLLGICLGHQSIGQAFGGRIVHAPELMHGKTDLIHHDNAGLFEGVAMPFVATRYHSLVIEPASMPEKLVVSAWTDTEGPVRSWAFATSRSCWKDGSFIRELSDRTGHQTAVPRFLNWGRSSRCSAAGSINFTFLADEFQSPRTYTASLCRCLGKRDTFLSKRLCFRLLSQNGTYGIERAI
ncbi:MAG: aminodeoxychorismate/anthranilate synthase component II [Pirellulaceae bacterium]